MEITRLGSAIDSIQKNPDIYISRDDSSLSDKLLLQLLNDAISLGVCDMAFLREGSWTAVGSNTDWLRLGKFQGAAPEELFQSIIPLVEAGQNSIRHEVVVCALSRAVMLFGPEGVAYIGGVYLDSSQDASARALSARLNKSRVIAYLTD